MPRIARLDTPGLLHHIMIRGIERRKIFNDDTDRENFIERLSILLPETKTQCYGWSLLSNHAHFLFRIRWDVGSKAHYVLKSCFGTNVPSHDP